MVFGQYSTYSKERDIVIKLYMEVYMKNPVWFAFGPPGVKVTVTKIGKWFPD